VLKLLPHSYHQGDECLLVLPLEEHADMLHQQQYKAYWLKIPPHALQPELLVGVSHAWHCLDTSCQHHQPLVCWLSTPPQPHPAYPVEKQSQHWPYVFVIVCESQLM
jgi:hypothetical protein